MTATEITRRAEHYTIKRRQPPDPQVTDLQRKIETLTSRIEDLGARPAVDIDNDPKDRSDA